MNKSTSHALPLIALLWIFFNLTACSSTPITSSDAAATDFKSLALKQQEHDKLLKRHDELLKEWSELKPGLERLLAIEEELNLLLGQLAQLSTSLEEETVSSSSNVPAPSVAHYSPTPSAQPVQETIATAAIPESIPEAESTEDTESTDASHSADANFALQVASIPEYYRLPAIWGQLLDKNPQLLADMKPNYQKTNVKNTDYYRLKIGSFATRQDANRKCNDLKAAGMNCLVVDYTNSNFDQITN